MALWAVLRSLFVLTKGTVSGLSERDAPSDPLTLFDGWFTEARKAGLFLPEAMGVSTATPEGHPSSRMMLLKGYDSSGFVFYTNYDSRKAEDLDVNPEAALLFHWNVLQRQVRVEGSVKRIAEAESAAYFKTRPRGSQLGAWASSQSAVIEGRDDLERSFEQRAASFLKREVPLPPFWGGYRLIPRRIEFWQGRLNRLHDRLLYTRGPDGWEVTRLAP